MIVYDAAKQMKSLWQFTEITVKELGSEIKGRLAIGASLTIGEYFLPEFLGRFMKRYPQLDIEVKIDNTVHICELLQSNKIDVGLVEGETGDKKFHKEEFYIDRLVLIGPIGSPKKDAATGSGNSNVDNARTGIGHKGAVGRVFREK